MAEKLTITDLFSDNGPFSESEVVEALRPHITIQKANNSIYFKDTKLTAEQKILVYGLAKKLLKAKNLIKDEMITAQEFHEATRIKKGTIDPLFKKLRDRGLLIGKVKYEIPNLKIREVINNLK